MKQVEYSQLSQLEMHYWWFVGKRLYLKQFLKHLPTSKSRFRIVDVGCGTGGTTQMLVEYGQVIGIEKNKLARELAKARGLTVRDGDVNHLALPPQRYDLITCLDVLYHQGVDEELAIQEFFRVLKPNGYLLILDCAGPELWSVHDVAMEARKRFTRTELEQLVTKYGFRVLKASYLFFLVYPLIYLQRKMLSPSQNRLHDASVISPLPGVVNICLLGLVVIDSWLLRFMPLPIGSSVVIWAQKT